ncbi:hypothetical protein ABE67_08705 [Cytobacillus firmus]|uniref:hypothetical protein n=1 Tax=Cytobacillus firmus TaxID=1399 RepID=UPI0018CFA842|nr:hypothetical protein [Cytobacillus firmus]MBG9444390.1 hypothetical protein [Cytobacillus firmus]MBG9449392.1 hypothetical protein [Cytobacillus firmus]URT71721.1 hypothetical protein NAF01_04440 [Cytobacillus firmus]WHY62596.1 hypothetical protein QNH42_04270 [Cytobacillus firmus]
MNHDRVVNSVTEKIYEREPSLLERFGEQGKEKCREDNHHHMKHLETAYELDQSSFFNDYAVWLNGILTRHGMKTRHLIDNFEIIQAVLAEEKGSAEKAERFHLYLAEAIAVLKGEPAEGGA